MAAERGYLREAGNLVFHISLLFLLLGVGIGTLYGFRGTSVVIVGQGFANNLTQYDDFDSGGRFAERRPRAVQPDGQRVRGEVRDRRRCSAGRPGCSAPMSRWSTGRAPRRGGRSLR